MEVYTHPFLVSASDAGDRSSPRGVPFIPSGTATPSPLPTLGSWVVRRARWIVWRQDVSTASVDNRTVNRSSSSPQANHFNTCTNPTPQEPLRWYLTVTCFCLRKSRVLCFEHVYPYWNNTSLLCVYHASVGPLCFLLGSRCINTHWIRICAYSVAVLSAYIICYKCKGSTYRWD